MMRLLLASGAQRRFVFQKRFYSSLWQKQEMATYNIVRQVAKNKEPSHKGWELAPQESTYNLKLIAAIRGHHSSIRLSSLFHMFPVDRYSSLDRRIGCLSSYNSRTRSRGLRQYWFVIFHSSFRFGYLSWHSNWGGEAWRKSGDYPLHSGFQDMVFSVFFRNHFPR